LNAPGAPPLVNYFPGYSILLAPVSTLPFWAAQLLSVAMTVAGLWAFGEMTEEERLPALALAAFTPLTVSMSGTVLSDVPTLAGVMLALLWAKRIWTEKDWKKWLLPALLAGFVALLRPTGFILSAAFALALALERRPRQALLFCATAGLFVVPFLVRNQRLTGRSLMYFVELSKPYEQSGALSANVLSNAGYYARLVFSSMLFRFPGEPAPLVAAAVGIGAVASLYGLREWGWKGWNKLPALFVVLYGLAHLLWSKQAGRYALPVLPLIFAYFLRGLAVLGPRVGVKKLPAYAGGLALALFLLPNAKIVQASWQKKSPVTRPPEKTLGWIRANLPADAVLATELDGRLYLLTNRRTVHLRKLFKPEEFHAWLKEAKATHVAFFPNDFALTTSRGDAFNDPMPAGPLQSLLADPGRYTLLFHEAEERAAIYAVKRPSDS
jgi:hypothetical protein